MDEAEVDEVLYFRSTWDKLADNIDFHLVISEVLPSRDLEQVPTCSHLFMTDLPRSISLRRA
jgi:hypothetical protein